MKHIYLIIAITLAQLSTWAQNPGSVRGTVKTSDGNPAEFVNVSIEGTAKGTIADKKGDFEIRNVAPGNYMLVASYVGLEGQKQEIAVKAGEVTQVDFTLKENTQELEEIVVSGGRFVTESPYVSKMPLKNIENPQVYNLVTSDLFRQQAITNFDDALKNVPGISKLWESTGRASGDGSSYYTLRGFEAQATIINGLPGLTSGSLDPVNIERIEVIKGPSSTLFGSSLISYGGLINTVTKKPYAGFGGEIGYMAGSFGLNRVTADINAPLKEDAVTLRVNTAYHTENSFQDAGFRNSFFISPTLAFKANERLSFLLVTEFMQEEKTNTPMLFLGRETPLQYSDLKDLNYNKDLSLTNNDLSIKNPRYNLQAQMNYKLSDSWTSQTVLSRGVAKSDGYYSYLYDNQNGNRDFALWISDQQSQFVTTDIQQNFIGDLKIGNLRNRVVVGLDYFHRNLINNSTGYTRVHNVNAQGQINYINPRDGQLLPPTYLTKQGVDNLLAALPFSGSNSKDAQYSVYVSDVLNITPQLLAMASLRVDYFDAEASITTDKDDYDQTTLSPKFGLIYQIIPDKVSAFANYMNGFKNIAAAELYDTEGERTGVFRTFKPEHANQMEFGVKSNLLSDKVVATISYYDINVSDVVSSDPANIFNSLQRGGEIESKGFEVDVNASPVEGLNFIVGYSYNDSKVIKGDEASVWLETGKRPISAGAKNLVNAWATYTFKSGPVNGLGIGFGGNYIDELPILDSKTTGRFTLPAYTIINGSLFYNTNAMRISFNINNITDKEYYTGYSTINPQKPRNFVVSLAYKF
ncbi:TonB-dependent receptor [Chryseosolibacter indicus]|uniref:TonB-dependent receptor n=1 Tax=Chryseosolibacter indicus TaxID=2782351 RepID=A0ABS5VVB2_9BACT|nr:TonB-dependent receptor [Chryseosolibacter indicus]MBT1704750.1 TonB-dependent receptor [Chryseosolibacter indicus]